MGVWSESRALQEGEKRISSPASTSWLHVVLLALFLLNNFILHSSVASTESGSPFLKQANSSSVEYTKEGPWGKGRLKLV